jgi:exosortase D (VPLPA-CTERM-specific)
LKGILYTIVIAAIYYTALKYLILHDWAREDYSHCYLIPFVVLYLLWEKREELTDLRSEVSWVGVFLLAFGIFLFWLGELGGEFFTIYISLWFVVLGLVWLHVGWRKIRVMAFPLFIVLMVFPFPRFINDKILLNLKLISSKLGVMMLRFYGMSVYREGNVIDLGFTQLQVVDACSGLRYLFPLMFLGLILAYWLKGRLWKRVALFLSSIPIAIVVNSLRIAVTGALSDFWGPAVAEGFLHGFSGWLIFLFAFGILLMEMWVLKKIGREKKGILETRYRLLSKSAHVPKIPVGVGRWSGQLKQPQFIVAVVILMLTLGLSQFVEFREKIPIKQPLNRIPLKMGTWVGQLEQMEPEFIKQLHFADYVIVNYNDQQGRTVNFYTAYYESQRKGESIHSPETCLPATGWEFREAGVVAIPMQRGASMQVNRAFMVKSGVRQLIYYWFAQRGRILTNLYQLKIYAFWDALTRQRTDGSLVRMITPVYPDEKLEDAEVRLQGFTREIVPVLDGFTPK